MADSEGPPEPETEKAAKEVSGRPLVALLAILLTVALGLSSVHLAIIAVQNMVELGPAVSATVPAGTDLSALYQRFALSLISLLVMAVFAVLFVRTALALLEQKKQALLGAIILGGVSMLYSVLVFNISLASLGARGGLTGAAIVLLLLPPSQAHFNREGPVYRKPKESAPLPTVQSPPPAAAAPAPPPPQATQVLCPSCRSTVPSEFIFCTRCGADLRIKAPQSPAPPPQAQPPPAERPAVPGKRFCTQCGKPNSIAMLYCVGCGGKLE